MRSLLVGCGGWLGFAGGSYARTRAAAPSQTHRRSKGRCASLKRAHHDLRFCFSLRALPFPTSELPADRAALLTARRAALLASQCNPSEVYRLAAAARLRVKLHQAPALGFARSRSPRSRHCAIEPKSAAHPSRRRPNRAGAPRHPRAAGSARRTRRPARSPATCGGCRPPRAPRTAAPPSWRE